MYPSVHTLPFPILILSNSSIAIVSLFGDSRLPQTSYFCELSSMPQRTSLYFPASFQTLPYSLKRGNRVTQNIPCLEDYHASHSLPALSLAENEQISWQGLPKRVIQPRSSRRQESHNEHLPCDEELGSSDPRHRG